MSPLSDSGSTAVVPLNTLPSAVIATTFASSSSASRIGTGREATAIFTETPAVSTGLLGSCALAAQAKSTPQKHTVFIKKLPLRYLLAALSTTSTANVPGLIVRRAGFVGS
ncbi:MAG: hypothetical protein WCO50_08690, partial [Synechococcus sp. ELA619]